MLSRHTEKLVNRCFDLTEQSKVRLLLEQQCSNELPLVGDNAALIERIQVAVIKLSQGKMGQLKNWIMEAQEDWRDVLDAADFYSDSNAHWNWRPELFPMNGDARRFNF